IQEPFCSGSTCGCCVPKITTVPVTTPAPTTTALPPVTTTPPAPPTTTQPPGSCDLIGKICGVNKSGVCRYGPCNHDESECYDNSCSGAYCRCCVPPVTATTPAAVTTTKPAVVTTITTAAVTTTAPSAVTTYYLPDMCISLGKTCGASNNGVCKATACNYFEIKIPDKLCSGSTCSCCVVKPPDMCISLGKPCGPSFNGVCKATACSYREIKTDDSFCSGSSCNCCVAKIPVPTTTHVPTTTSPTTGTCHLVGKPCGEHNDGICRNGKCNPGETEYHDNLCSGAYCRCCVLTVLTTTPAATTTSPSPDMCIALGKTCGASNNGVCKATACNYFEIKIQDKLCSGSTCNCCVVKPPDMCISLGKPCGPSFNGVCKATACSYGEIKTDDSFCSGSTCNCCVAKILVGTATAAPTTTSATAGTCKLIGNQCGEHNDGICRNGKCNPGETECHDNFCSGAYCTCCVLTVFMTTTAPTNTSPAPGICHANGHPCGEHNDGICRNRPCNH
ncbi:unnamed protein product, partial [Meganyctiphanes norvegica]